MFKISIAIVTPTNTHIGTAMSRSPKVARRLAICQAWNNMIKNDIQACPSIGMEWLTMFRNGKLIASRETYTG